MICQLDLRAPPNLTTGLLPPNDLSLCFGNSHNPINFNGESLDMSGYFTVLTSLLCLGIFRTTRFWKPHPLILYFAADLRCRICNTNKQRLNSASTFLPFQLCLTEFHPLQKVYKHHSSTWKTWLPDGYCTMINRLLCNSFGLEIEQF